MRNCPSCSRECADNSRFCAWCAAPLDATSAETEVLAPPVSDPLLAVAAIAIYGFRTSLAGRPLFQISGE